MATDRVRVVGTVLFALVAIRAGAQTTAEPLRLVLACDEASTPTFRLTIQNVSAAPTAAIIGTVIANGKWYVLGHLSVTLSRRGIPDISFDYSDPSAPAGIAGRVNHWFIQLPAGASYSVIVPVEGHSGWFAKPAQVHASLATYPIGMLGRGMEAVGILDVWVVADIRSNQLSKILPQQQVAHL